MVEGESKEGSPASKQPVKFLKIEGGHIRFDGFVFPSIARFERATFSGIARFGSAIFSGDAGFGGQTFPSDVFFNHATFKEKANFSIVKFERIAQFNGARFLGDADFNAMRGERSFSMADAIFEAVPDFIQAHFEEAPRLDNMRVAGRLLTSGDGKPSRQAKLHRKLKSLSYTYRRITSADHNIPARWRALKRLAIEGHDTDRELDFFSGEIRSARFAGDWPLRWPVWKASAWNGFLRFWAGLLYQIFSNFGRSLLRPVMFWGLLIINFAVYFLGQNEGMTARRTQHPEH